LPLAFNYLRSRYADYNPDLIEPYYSLLHPEPERQAAAARQRARNGARAGDIRLHAAGGSASSGASSRRTADGPHAPEPAIDQPSVQQLGCPPLTSLRLRRRVQCTRPPLPTRSLPHPSR
jgi:hypothetical protein